VHDGNDLRCRVGGQHSRGIDRLAPREVDAHDLGPALGRHLAHADAEQPIDGDDDNVTGLDDVDKGGFHPGRAGAADRQRQRVDGAEYGAQPLACLVQHGDELGIEMAEHGPAHGRDHFGIGLHGPGPMRMRSLIGTSRP